MTGYAPLLEHSHDRQGIADDMNLPNMGFDLPNSDTAAFYDRKLEVASIVAVPAPEGKNSDSSLALAPRQSEVTLAPEPRQSVLIEAQGLVHGDRNQQYGAPAEEYKRTVGMVNSLLASKLREPLNPEDLAYIMVCLKLSRQINKPKRDSLTDAAGYCEVAQWIIDAR